MSLDVYLQPKQREAMQMSEKYPVLFYGGAKGGGKSHLLRAREVIRRLKYKDSKGLIVRKTYPELLSNHIRQFFKEYPMVKEWFNKAEKTIYWPNGSLTEFSYLKNTDDVYTYQGREYDDIGIDEVTQHEEEVVKVLRTSLRTTNPAITPSMVLTGNPGGIGHGWVKRLFIEKSFLPDENPMDYGFVQAKVQDNRALLDADPGYIQRLQDLPEKWRKAYLNGDWDIFEGQFFSEFNRNVHVVDPFVIEPWYKKIIAIDYGFTAPSCVLFIAYDDQRNIIVYNELYRPRMTYEQLAQEVLKLVDGKYIQLVVADPSIWAKEGTIGESGAEVMQRYFNPKGISLLKADNERVIGWGQVREIMKTFPGPLNQTTSRLKIFRSCENLVRTIPQALFDPKKPEDIELEEDHALDAARYGILFLTRMEQAQAPLSPLDQKIKSLESTVADINPNKMYA
jgi:phage terminase large subunit